MEEKRGFLGAFNVPGANRRAVCREWGISAKTGYALARRVEQEGEAALVERSHRPRSSPNRTGAEVEAVILGLRDAQPARGARKIANLMRRGGAKRVPSLSTITAILERNGRIDREESQKRKAFVRFERERPNELWQMDFKGHFGLLDGNRCHALMLLDDHSRYCVGARACANERAETVQAELRGIFREYGLPEAMLMDNGAPWGSDWEHVYTPFVLWLIRLGIRVLHGRPRHPQTQGKLERLNRTVDVELLRQVDFWDQAHAQEGLDWWRPQYNEERPHEALGDEVPASRYQVSERAMPDVLRAVEYEEKDETRKVQHGGWVSYRGREYRLPQALHGCVVALRPTEVDGQMAVYFCRQRVAVVDLKGGVARPVRG
ncbi:MAG TPA: IS481 family transposase [Longimicrobiaceae bacterium]|nr:IS481 family transposase [Longimicrobiaceae bacterium]